MASPHVRSGVRNSKLLPSFSCPDILDFQSSLPPSGLTQSIRGSPDSASISSIAVVSSKRKVRSPIPRHVFNGPGNGLARSWGTLQNNVFPVKTHRDGRKPSLQVQMLISKYPKPLRPSPNGARKKSKEKLFGEEESDGIDMIGPSPVCIVINRVGKERVEEVEESDSGLLVPIGLQQHYLGGSMERLSMSSGMDSEVGPFRRETGAERETSSPQPMHALLENPESETRWYFKYFLGKVHHNYLCYDPEKNPFFLSVVNSGSIYRCILWKKTGNKRLCVKQGSSGKWPSPKSLLEKFSVSKYEKNVKEVATANIQKDLLTLEEQEGAVNFKFGVLYAKAGQKSDNEMFSMVGSPAFAQFLDLLGDEVTLEGWEHFRGGLDNKNNSTGTQSVYTVFEGHEIMFHVSTMLPYTMENKQQLERKRHIGNDIVVIIFIDGEDDDEAYQSALNFNPSCMKSHFNHIFALVTYRKDRNIFQVVVRSAESVPAFGPPIPGDFSDHIGFRDFLLAKLINAEKAAYCTPTFAMKRERTLDLLLKGVEEKCVTEYRRALSVPQMTPQSSPGVARKYWELERSFTDYGQRLKVQKIITGHHPTSQRTTVAPKKDPWETICVAEEFPYKITCGDACEDETLIVSTQSDGTYFLFKDGSYSLIIDKSVPIGQLAMAHRHHVLLFRTNYAKENNYLYAIPLKDFYSDKIKIGNKSTLRPYHIPYTKGCHLFCTAPLDGQFLRVGVAVKTKVYMLAWKHPATMTVNGSPVTPRTTPNPIDSFIKHRELSFPDVPVQMTLLDERPSGKLCVSYQKQTVVDAIDEIKATTQRIPNLDIAKAKLTSLSSVHSNGRSELLVGYNLTCQLITLHDGTAYNSVEMVWNSEPKDLVYMFPYILAFTANTVEIRMASNGSLMQTILVPDIHLFSKKGDLYFTSTSLLHNAKTDSRLILPDTKMPKNIDKKGFSASCKYVPPGMVYIYKITAERMMGRRDSTASIQSVQSMQSALSNDDAFTRSSVSEATEIDSQSDSSSVVDFTQPSTEESEHPSQPPNFFIDTSPLGGTNRKRFAARRKVLASMVADVQSETVDITNGSGHLSILDPVGFESPTICSSPDSGMRQNAYSDAVCSSFRTRSTAFNNSLICVQSQSHSEAPTILGDGKCPSM